MHRLALPVVVQTCVCMLSTMTTILFVGSLVYRQECADELAFNSILNNVFNAYIFYFIPYGNWLFFRIFFKILYKYIVLNENSGEQKWSVACSSNSDIGCRYHYSTSWEPTRPILWFEGVSTCATWTWIVMDLNDLNAFVFLRRMITGTQFIVSPQPSTMFFLPVVCTCYLLNSFRYSVKSTPRKKLWLITWLTMFNMNCQSKVPIHAFRRCDVSYNPLSTNSF